MMETETAIALIWTTAAVVLGIRIVRDKLNDNS